MKVSIILNCSYLEKDLIFKAVQFAVKAGADGISPSAGIEVEDDDEVFLPVIIQAGGQKVGIKVLGIEQHFKTFQRLHEKGCSRLGTHDLPGLLKEIDKE